MKYRSVLLALLMMTPASLCLRAQQSAPQTDGPAVNVNSVLATLKQIKDKQHKDIASAETSLSQTFMSNASSPESAIAYYLDAVDATQFNGLNHEAKELQTWKKAHEGEFKDTMFRDALCLHLMYLSLTVSHDAGVKVKDLLPTLLAYTQQVRANQDQLASQEQFMTVPLSKSIFVHWLQIDQYVTDDTDWELIPIKVDNIYTKVILPEYRTEKNAAGIFQYWDDRIQREGAAAVRPLDVDNFNKVTKPSLLWQRSEEYVGLGQKNNAITNMMSLIQTYPYHPDAPDWITEVEKLVKPATPPPPVAPVDTPAPVQAATPTPTPANPSASPPASTPASSVPDSLQPVQN